MIKKFMGGVLIFADEFMSTIGKGFAFGVGFWLALGVLKLL